MNLVVRKTIAMRKQLIKDVSFRIYFERLGAKRIYISLKMAVMIPPFSRNDKLINFEIKLPFQYMLIGTKHKYLCRHIHPLKTNRELSQEKSKRDLIQN